MGSPSEPLLERLRHAIDARGLNAASVAARAGLERERLRRVLAGHEPITVDELIGVAQALDLSPDDLGLTMPMGTVSDLDYEPPEPDDPFLGGPGDEIVVEDVLDPYGNHVRQLFEVGFALGCDFFFFAEAAELQGSGVPAHVLEQHAGAQIPLRLDAAYHADHEPRLEAAGIRLRMGFDALYDCFFPWTAIKRLMFLPATPVLDEEEEEPPAEPKDTGVPFLRLVE